MARKKEARGGARSADKLRVFISSTMSELLDARDIVNESLERRGIDAFVYEAHAGARPETVVETSLEAVETADIFVGLFRKDFGEVTAKEYRHARHLGKPCFVYVRDRSLRRDGRLEEFLAAEVYDLSKGVSYDFFDNVVDLGGRIADDVMAWLVRKHREMTAEIGQARVSRDELARLAGEVERLRGLSRETLPVGTGLDYLARQMKGWFGTLGYRFERHDVRREEAFEWVINIPRRRSGYDRVAVLGVEGEVGLGEVAALRKFAAGQKADEGWVVATRRVSQGARDEAAKPENKDLVCCTFDELLDQDADFTAYLDWLEQEVRRRGIDRLYVPLACTKEEFDPATKQRLGLSRYDGRNGWIEGYIDRWLADPSKEHISVLGEFGTGKTWFALHYAWRALEQYREAKRRGVERPRIPLVIPLRDYAKAVTVESLFSEFFFRKHEIPLPGYSAFEQLNRMGKLLLIFDGFDEMADRVDRQKMIDNFWTLAQVVVPGAKAILTCRTEHFPEATEGRALLRAELQASTAALTGRPPQFEVLELEKFGDPQIREVLSKRAAPQTVERVMGDATLLDLARRPVMTELILEALPEIEAGKPVDIARVYLYAVRRKMERDIKAERTFTSLADKLYFMCELSWEMLSTDQMSFNYRLFPERLSRLFGPAVREQKDMDHWRYDMMGQTMLIRNADGDYTPAHRSLLEFFVAYKFAAELGALAHDFAEPAQKQSYTDRSAPPQDYVWSAYFRRELDASGAARPVAPLDNFAPETPDRLASTLGKEPLSAAVLDLLKNMLDPSDAATARLLSILDQTRGDEAPADTAYLGGNLATLLTRRDPHALKGRDLSRANLSAASFLNADLTATNFRAADLTKASFTTTTLEHADMRDADLTGANFQEMTEIQSVAFSADGRRLASAGEDGTAHVWDVRTGAELLTLRSESGGGINVCWGAGDRLLALAAGKGVQIYDSDSGDVLRTIPEVFGDWTMGVSFHPDGKRLAVAGGIRGGIRILNTDTGKQVKFYDHPLQTNRVIYSPDGEICAASAWARQGRKTNQGLYKLPGPIVVDTRSEKVWTTSDEITVDTWGLAFSSDSRTLFLGDFKGRVIVCDIPSKRRVGECYLSADADVVGPYAGRVWGLAASPSNHLLACFYTSKVFLRSLPSLGEVLQLEFPPGVVSREFRNLRGYPGDVAFDPNGKLLAGGHHETIVLWDARLFIKRSGEPHINIVEYLPPELGAISDDPGTWPDWWQRCKIEVPEGMVPNPDFGKCLRVIEQKLRCEGLQIIGAKGLDETSTKYNERTLGAWLVTRGAIRFKRGGKSAPERKAGRGRKVEG